MNPTSRRWKIRWDLIEWNQWACASFNDNHLVCQLHSVLNMTFSPCVNLKRVVVVLVVAGWRILAVNSKYCVHLVLNHNLLPKSMSCKHLGLSLWVILHLSPSWQRNSSLNICLPIFWASPPRGFLVYPGLCNLGRYWHGAAKTNRQLLRKHLGKIDDRCHPEPQTDGVTTVFLSRGWQW